MFLVQQPITFAFGLLNNYYLNQVDFARKKGGKECRSGGNALKCVGEKPGRSNQSSIDTMATLRRNIYGLKLCSFPCTHISR